MKGVTCCEERYYVYAQPHASPHKTKVPGSLITNLLHQKPFNFLIFIIFFLYKGWKFYLINRERRLEF